MEDGWKKATAVTYLVHSTISEGDFTISGGSTSCKQRSEEKCGINHSYGVCMKNTG
jgi:hypothetical protein